MRRHRIVVGLFCLIALVSTATLSGAEFTTDKTDKGVTVKLDGKLFTEYLIQSGKKPSLWPIIGPTGKPMTRPWPIDKSAVEGAAKDDITSANGAKAWEKPLTNDHPHHRSLWFGHQIVNDSNTWLESGGSGAEKHREFKEVSGGKQAKIVAVNDWVDKDGKKLCEDERTITCSTDGDNRIIDFDIVITASAGDVTFGDEKDGLFAVRVPDSMRVEAAKGDSSSTAREKSTKTAPGASPPIGSTITGRSMAKRWALRF